MEHSASLGIPKANRIDVPTRRCEPAAIAAEGYGSCAFVLDHLSGREIGRWVQVQSLTGFLTYHGQAFTIGRQTDPRGFGDREVERPWRAKAELIGGRFLESPTLDFRPATDD
jgi:hypothetical protein